MPPFSQELFRALIEHSVDAVCVLDERGLINYANPAFRQLFGFEPEAAGGQWVFEIVHPEDVASVVAQFEALVREPGVVARVEYRARLSDGTWTIRSSIAQNLLDDPAVGGVVVHGSDVTEQRRAERALRASEARYRRLVETTHEGICTVDPTGCITYANRRFAQMLGYPMIELAGRPFFDLMAPEVAFEARTRFARRQRGLSEVAELPIVRSDGATAWVRKSASSVFAADGSFLGATYVLGDITEQRRAEAALREAHREMQTVVDAAPVAIMTLDRGGRIRSWNATAERIFGWSADEVIGHENPLIPSTHQPAYAETLRALLDGTRRITEEGWPTLRKDGTLAHSSVSSAPLRAVDGAIIGCVALVADVTERQVMESALHETRRQMELLLASTGEGICAIDAEGLITFVNPAAARMFGTSADRLLGHGMHAMVHHTHPDGTPYDVDECPVNASIRDGAVHRVDTETFWREDGTSFPVEYVSTPLREDGRIVGAVVAFQDITQRRQLEQQLRQAQKMEAVGRLAGGVAHDFNNLLTVIMGYTAMLLAELPSGDPVVADLQEIHAASERAAALTRQLLAFSRRQVLEPRVIDLQQVIGAMDKMLRRLIGEDIQLSIMTGPTTSHAHADPGQIEQVVMNLVINARDAMPTGGRLEIVVETVRLTGPEAERLPYVVPGDYVHLRVRDTGCGMDENTRAQVFDPFFTTKEPGKGTGLGLATVYGIVKQSGGYIFVDTAPGEGATFHIYLPRVAEQPATGTVSVPTEIVPEPCGATVLLAEDESALRAMVERVLTKRGYRVLVAHGGPDALAAAERHDGAIDLLVTDVVMPDMSGQELAARLAQQHGEIPVLFMTGYSADLVANHGALRAGSQLLKKPFSPQELSLAASELLRAAASRTGEHRTVAARREAGNREGR